MTFNFNDIWRAMKDFERMQSEANIGKRNFKQIEKIHKKNKKRRNKKGKKNG